MKRPTTLSISGGTMQNYQKSCSQGCECRTSKDESLIQTATLSSPHYNYRSAHTEAMRDTHSAMREYHPDVVLGELYSSDNKVGEYTIPTNAIQCEQARKDYEFYQRSVGVMTQLITYCGMHPTSCDAQKKSEMEELKSQMEERRDNAMRAMCLARCSGITLEQCDNVGVVFNG